MDDGSWKFFYDIRSIISWLTDNLAEYTFNKLTTSIKAC